MSKTLKVLYPLALIALLVSSCIPSTADEKYVTIAEIREETKNGWHETYTVDGQTITVDVEIEIPDVDSVAAIQVTFSKDLHPDAPASAVIARNDKTGFIYYVSSKTNSFLGEVGNDPAGSMRLTEKGAQAENSPLTPEEALKVFQDLVQPYLEATGSFDLQLVRIDAYTRLYKKTSFSESGDTLDYNVPITDMGRYDITFNQIFHGIPYIRSTPPFYLPAKAGTIFQRPEGSIYGSIASKEDYAFCFQPAVEDGLVAEDVPLVPFSKVKQEFERIIRAGYIRDIFRVRLEYVCLDNPKDLGNSFILVPVWELNGILIQNPKRPGPDISEEEKEKLKLVGAQEALVNAQTGKYYDPMDQSIDRSHANIITWEQVK